MQLCFQPAQVARHQRLHVRVGRGGGEPFPLPHLRRDIAGQGDRHLRHRLGQDISCAPLMHRIDEGMQEADRDALHIFFPQHRHKSAYRRFVQRAQHVALIVQPLRHRQAQVTGHQRFRKLDVQVVLVVTALIAHRQHVAKALGGDQRGARALAFDDCVGGQRGAMNHHRDVGRAHTRLRQNRTRPLQHGTFRRCRRGQDFGSPACAATLQRDIRERAADIHRQPGKLHPCVLKSLLSGHSSQTRRGLASYSRNSRATPNASRAATRSHWSDCWNATPPSRNTLAVRS